MTTFDLLVVGAGPAGSAAAIAALRAAPRARVLVVDRQAFPRDKCCGDGVGPDGVAVLDRLGVRHDVLRGAPAVRDVSITGPRGRDAAGRAGRAGYVVPRLDLDARLLRAAEDHGAEVLQQRVRRLDLHGDEVVVDGRLRARTVVGADGAYSTVRRLLGAGSQPARHRAVAMRGYATDDVATRGEGLRFRFLAEPWPAYLWSFPLGDGRANVGVCTFDTSRSVDARWLRTTVERSFPTVEVDTLSAHQLPLSTARPRVHHGRVLLAGDAAALVNPLTGEGIATALLSGALAGAAAVTTPDRPGPAYRRALGRHLGRHLRHTGLAARAYAHRAAVDLALGVVGDHPELLADVIELGLGTGPLRLRMLRRAVTPRHLRSIRSSAGVPE